MTSSLAQAAAELWVLFFWRWGPLGSSLVVDDQAVAPVRRNMGGTGSSDGVRRHPGLRFWAS